MQIQIKTYRPDKGVSVLQVDATTPGEARKKTEQQGYRVLSLHHNTARRWHPSSDRDFSVPLFAQELLALLDAGLGLVESLDLLAAKARQTAGRRILTDLRLRLSEGSSFSQATASASVFSGLFVATVRASEQTGQLPEALRRYLTYHRQINSLRDKVLAGSVYPMLLIGIGTLVVLFLLTYVVPRFARIYEDVGQERLPLLSRWMMEWGVSVAEHTLPLVFLAAAFLSGFLYYLSRAKSRAAIERWLWSLPLLGEKMRVYQLARFTRTLAMLLQGGVPLVSALGMADDLLRQPALREGLKRATMALNEGHPVSQALTANGLATEIGARLLIVGERSGELAEAMERIAAFYDDEIGRSVEWFSRLFEPALMVFIGLLIGGIVILMYMPIFELASSIQ